MLTTARGVCLCHSPSVKGSKVKRIVCAAVFLGVTSVAPLGAQGPTVNELKGKIFDGHMLEKTFVNGLRFCKELDGKNFYFEPRNRVLNLDEYHRSLENLARERVFNPATHRPWTEEDAAARWDQVQKEALTDKANCELVATLPELEKQLEELEKKTAASKKE
jgi:hypothetical protein